MTEKNEQKKCKLYTTRKIYKQKVFFIEKMLTDVQVRMQYGMSVVELTFSRHKGHRDDVTNN